MPWPLVVKNGSNSRVRARLIDAGSLIVDGDVDSAAGGSPNTDSDRSSARHRFASVADHVEQRLFYLRLIDAQQRQTAVDVQLYRHGMALQIAAHELAGLGDELADVFLFHAQRLPAGD